ncbi:hypothetical protein ENBRE01_0710 [Enteropsectra breve]|nr:hypothetical protein ENBRE01_0710 [Enteropsectra breve]
MIWLASLFVISILQINASGDTMLIKNHEFKGRIANDLACVCCLRALRENERQNSFSKGDSHFQNYSSTFFCCPACTSIAHLTCFLNTSVKRQLKCPNLTCNLVLKKNDINKLFAHLLYATVTKNIHFRKYKNHYARFISENRKVSHMEIMNILINSHSLSDFGQLKLWEMLRLYFNQISENKANYFKWYYDIIKAGDEYEYESILSLPPQKHPETEIELINTARKLRAINSMHNQLSNIDGAANLLNVYEFFVANESDRMIQWVLAGYFTDNIMRRENPFKCMEDIYVKLYHGRKDLIIEELLTPYYLVNLENRFLKSDFVNNVLAELGKNNIYAVEKRINAYLKNTNKGVFIPTFINYFEHNGMPGKAREIALLQLDLFNKNTDFQGMSIKNTIYLLKTAPRLGIFLELEHIEKMLCKLSLLTVPLTAGEVSSISSYLQERMQHLIEYQQEIVRYFFVKNYTKNLGKIYVRCMPGEYYLQNSKMNDFKVKREEYLHQECNEGYAEIAQQNHAELNALRDEFFKEVMAIQ